MASVSMAPSVAVAVTAASVSAANPVFSSTSSVRMTGTVSFAAPLRVSQRLRVIAMASPQGTQTSKSAVEQAIDDAEEVCAADEESPGCANAWDDVEELAAHAYHQKENQKDNKDPMEQYCKESPEADECRVYED